MPLATHSKNERDFTTMPLKLAFGRSRSRDGRRCRQTAANEPVRLQEN